MRLVIQSAKGTPTYSLMSGATKYANALMAITTVAAQSSRNASFPAGEKCSGGRKWSYDIGADSSRPQSTSQGGRL